MTPAARVQSSIEILDTILSGMATEQALTRWARANRFAGSKDRAALRDLVFSAIRCRSSFAFLGGSGTGRGLMIGSLIAENANIDEMFCGLGYAPEPLTDDERSTLKSPEDVPDDIAVDLPDWIWAKFQEDLGDSAAETAKVLRNRAPVFLRVNLKKCTQSQAVDLLKAEEIDVRPHSLSDTALEVTTNPRRIALSKAYTSGFVELQDTASQAVCDFLELPNAGRILDYCAGGGGKSLAMAARTEADIFAHDAHSSRMSDLPSRAERASISLNILDEIPNGAQFDLVLCDVPCSGSGSWRRSPDGKWGLSKESLADLNATQTQILTEAAKLVKPHGELAYATCSVFACENRDRVDAFIFANPDWSVISDRQFLPQQGGDGFYIARLTRA
jgi:16S rRNA (cytosine967-C5)-methyltransferase